MYFYKFLKVPQGRIKTQYASSFDSKKFIIVPFCNPYESLGKALNDKKNSFFLNKLSGSDIDIIYIEPKNDAHYSEFNNLIYSLADEKMRNSYSNSFIFLLSRYFPSQTLMTYDVTAMTSNGLQSFLTSLIELLKNTRTPLTTAAIKEINNYGISKIAASKFKKIIDNNSQYIFQIIANILQNILNT